MVTKIKSYFNLHPLIIISIVYFIFRLVNLTILPLFNDEAIYLDWAWRETSEPGMLFYSLYDAKQPFLMWFFGIAMHLFSNPFFAGRFVSVVCGFITMLGIYKIGKMYFSQKIAFYAALLYIAIPIFSFYDRQALMESGIAASGVWILYVALKFWEKHQTKDAVSLGILLGISYMIKSSALLFLVTFFLISLLSIRKKKSSFKQLFYASCAFLCTISLLFLQPVYWQTLSSNSRYGFSIIDLLHFPIVSWAANIVGDAEIGFIFLTPFVFLGSILGLMNILKKGQNEQKMLGLWIIVVFVLQILFIRSTSQRYFVAYLPPLILFGVAGFLDICVKLKRKSAKIAFGILFFTIPFMVTFMQIQNPLSYFSLFSFSHYSEGGAYVTGQTSGFGIDQAISYIEKLPKGRKIFVGEAVYTGNPESALIVWFVKSKNVTVGYLDRSLLGDSVNDVDCMQTNVPVYFVSKKNDVAGLDKFLQNITYLKNKYNNNVIGIWKLKEHCTGKSLPFQLVNSKS